MDKSNWQTFELEGGELFGLVTVRLHPDVISQVDDEWRKQFYPLDEPNEIACHIAYNKIANNWDLANWMALLICRMSLPRLNGNNLKKPTTVSPTETFA